MKKTFIFAAVAGMLSLTACSGKPVKEQAAEDAQKINLDAAIPQMAAALAEQCGQGRIDIDCPADKAKGFIKTYPAVAAAVGEYDKKCAQTYGAKLCAQGYGSLLADNLADRLAAPVAAGAKESLKAKEAAARRAAAARAEAAKAAAEAAARRAAEEQAKAEAAAKDLAAKTAGGTEAAKAAAPKAESGAGAAHQAPAVKTPPAAPAGSAGLAGQ